MVFWDVFGYGILFIPLILIGIMFFVFWLITLIDAVTRKFKDDMEKVIWVLVIILTGILGSFIYYFIIFRKDKTKSLKWFWGTILMLAIIFILFLLWIFLRKVVPEIFLSLL